MLLHFKGTNCGLAKLYAGVDCKEMTLSPVTTLLLGVILGCVVTTLIHSLTVSCVQCGSSSSRGLVGLDRLSSIAGSDRFRVRGVITSETSCATLRLQLETTKAVSPSSDSNRRKKRNVDNAKGV